MVPWHPAAVWMQNLPYIHSVASRLAAEADRERLVDEVMRMHGAAAALRAESLRLLEHATDRRWWAAGRLMSTSASPDVLGRLTLAGVDPWTRSIGEWCAATYALCVKGQDEKGRLKFDFQLSVPPAGYEDEWDDEGDDPAAIQDAIAKMMG
jgi:hypothetical protein